MASSLHWCTHVSLLPSVWFVSTSSCCRNLCCSRIFRTWWLYLSTIWGSIHLSLLADGIAVGCADCHPSNVSGISIHTALWSLRMPTQKVKYPVWIPWRKSLAMNIPSIGFWPQLWVCGPFVPWVAVTASSNSIWLNTVKIGWTHTFLLISASIMTKSRLLCHCSSWLLRWSRMIS